MKTTTALLRRGVKEGELAKNVKGIHGNFRCLQILADHYEQS
jgi:hypothetical protein